MVEESYYKYDLDQLNTAYAIWTDTFPKIKPFYAVKCNPNPRVVERLASLGANFDCASPAEIKLVLSLGVSPGRIIYANPCKQPCEIAESIKNGVKWSTLDSVCEVAKMPQGSEVLIRIRADDPDARCNLGSKYGAEMNEISEILGECRAGALKVVGVSFHVGSYSRSENAYLNALSLAGKVMKEARTFGFNPTVLDIGGGFVFGSLPLKLNYFIDKMFPGMTVIAEPGRFFAETVATLYTPVIGIKKNSITISESLYGSFNCMIFDHAAPKFTVLGATGNFVSKTMFGSTCDGGDVIYKECLLPENIKVGDWLEWTAFGAYTSAASTQFNGIPFNNRLTRYY